jgi:hypothetical protein
MNRALRLDRTSVTWGKSIRVTSPSQLARPVDLGREQLSAGPGMGPAPVDVGFLAALDLGDHVDDQLLVVKRAE